MRQINVLHLFPESHSPFLSRILAFLPRHFNNERFQNVLATMAYHWRPIPRQENASLVHALGLAFGPGFPRLIQLARRENIQIIHTYLEPARISGLIAGKCAGIKLFAHTYLGDHQFFSRHSSMAPFSWQSHQRISVANRSTQGVFQKLLKSSGHKVFLNPFAIPAELFSAPTDTQEQLITRICFVIEDYDRWRKELPQEIKQAFASFKERVPNSFLRYKAFADHQGIWAEKWSPGGRSSAIMAKDGKEKDYLFYVLLLPKMHREMALLRLTELITQGSPTLLVGDPPSLSESIESVGVWKVPLHTGMLKTFFTNCPTQPGAITPYTAGLQKALRENSFEKSSALWQMQYEAMIEEVQDRRLISFKRDVIDKGAAQPLQDPEFLALLACAKCHGALSWEVTEFQGERAWHGKLHCECGEQYPLLRGVPRIYEGAMEEYSTLLEGRCRGKTSPSARNYWLRRFNGEAIPLQGYYRRMVNALLPLLKKDQLVLDLSCTSGAALSELARHGVRAIGLGSGPEIETAQNFLRDFPQIRLVQGRKENPPFRVNGFDLCFCADALLGDGNQSQTLGRWRDLLKEKGLLHLSAQDLPFVGPISRGENLPPSQRRLHRTGRVRFLRALRSVVHPLPLSWISAVAYLFATLEVPFRSALSAGELRSTWFRLLAYPEADLPSQEQLQSLTETVKLHDLRIQYLKPSGFHLSAVRDYLSPGAASSRRR